MDDVKLTVRLPADVHAGLVEMATANGRSMNQEIVWVVNQKIKGDGDSALSRQLSTIEIKIGLIYDLIHDLSTALRSMIPRRAPEAVVEQVQVVE